MISERIKAALARSKNRGKLGLRNPILHSKTFRRRLQASAAVALRKAAMERAEAYRIHIEWALSQPGLNDKLITFRGAGEKLNELQIPSPMGGRWSSMNVADIAVRLKLREKPIRVPRKVLQERVEALWRSHPECTGPEVVEMLKPKYSIGICRALALLRNSREASAKRSPTLRRMGWQLDRRTAARMRIGAIWERHPEFTAQRVLKELGPKHSVGKRWVQQILRECWQATARLNSKRRRGDYRARHP
jgi:hypothetical protein